MAGMFDAGLEFWALADCGKSVDKSVDKTVDKTVGRARASAKMLRRKKIIALPKGQSRATAATSARLL
jgi:hypothetical protein